MVGVSKGLNSTTKNSQTIEVDIINGKVLIPRLHENKHSLLGLEVPALPDLAKHNSCKAWLTLRVLDDGQLSIIGLSRLLRLPPVYRIGRQSGSPQGLPLLYTPPLAPEKMEGNGFPGNRNPVVRNLDSQFLSTS